MKYRAEIDGLRALAVLTVIPFHAGFELFSGGYVGVDIFFVISGYLITSIILNDLQKEQFSLVRFYERRARRILPALFFIILVCVPLAWLILTPMDMKDFAESLVAVIFFSSNFLFLSESGYFDTAAELKPLLHTWSLAVEEQYYLLFPLFLMFTWKLGKKVILAVLAIIFFVSLVLAEKYILDNPEAVFFMLVTRSWEILLGAFCAFYRAGHPLGIIKLQHQILSILGLILIALAVTTFDRRSPIPGLYALIPTLGATMIILFANEETIGGKLLRFRLLVGIGLISYSAYLWHHPIFTFSYLVYGVVLESHQLIILILVTMLLAYLSYKYVEQPFRRPSFVTSSTGNRSRPKRKVKTEQFLLGVSIFTALAFGSVGIATDGNFFRYDEKVISETIKSTEKEYVTCGENFEKSCGDKISTAQVFIFGDSNAYHFGKMLENKYSAENVISLTLGGCLPLANFTRLEMNASFNQKCLGFNESIKKTIENFEEKKKIAIVSAAWLLYFVGDNLYAEVPRSKLVKLAKMELADSNYNAIAETEKIRAFSSYIRQVIDILKAGFEEVVVVGPIPPLPYSTRESRYLFNGTPPVPSEVFLRYSKPLLSAMRKIQNEVVLILPHKKVCDTFIPDYCVSFINNRHLYGDQTHVSKYGQYIIYEGLLGIG